MEEPTEPLEAPDAAEPDTAARWPRWGWPALAAAAIAGLILANVFLVLQLNDTNDDVAALSAALDRSESLAERAAGNAADAISRLEQQVGAAQAEATAAARAAEAAQEAAEIASQVGLPLFTGDPVNDPAIGTVLTEIGGVEYYLGQEIGFDLTDGRSRAIVVWAHWCPFCQEELPALSAWIEENAVELPNVEVLSITTAIDDTADNPLEPYLDESRFPFPVLVDDDGALARLLGVDAFPFWLFVGPDGTVLGRLTGLRGMDELGSIITQLNDLAA